ncbi:hypothetical protein A3F66_02975 [candidate division TM6 bacterium RIFCSPHIGHO2_12_FULL_32_22]|nr:MAG: hypothetical protein A3F66_02975 [candidate division TM6 bacterium RIFCSPHIGHO2_12_FULL_32_22]
MITHITIAIFLGLIYGLSLKKRVHFLVRLSIFPIIYFCLLPLPILESIILVIFFMSAFWATILKRLISYEKS